MQFIMDMLVTPVKRYTLANDGSLHTRRYAGFAASRWQLGFTLIELIVTMIIIGILAAFVVPRFSLLGGFNEVGYRDKVKSTLEYARKAAVAQRRNVRVTLASNNLTLDIDNDIPEGAGAGSYPRALSLPATDRACNPTAANKICAPSGVTLSGPTTPLTFSPLGRPGGTTNCTSSGNPAYCYILTGESAQTVTVEAETGYVH